MPDKFRVTVTHKVPKRKKLLSDKRKEQAKSWLWREIQESLLAEIQADPEIRQLARDLEQAVISAELSPQLAAKRLLEQLLPGKSVSHT